MPIYDFKCPNCGEEKEALVKTTEGPYEVRCPECDRFMQKNGVGLSNFQLKGKGWYKTDFKNKT